jgi:hypothetical protein
VSDHIVPTDLDLRRSAIIRAFRATTRDDDSAVLRRRVDALAARVDELATELAALRCTVEPAPPVSTGGTIAGEEAPAPRITVPPVTPAKISDQALDVLLGTVRAG